MSAPAEAVTREPEEKENKKEINVKQETQETQDLEEDGQKSPTVDSSDKETVRQKLSYLARKNKVV